MAEWAEAPDLRDLAEKIIARREDVSHVDAAEVLFLWEYATKPKAQGMEILARTWSNKDKPIQFFTPARFTIAFYEQTCGYMSAAQHAWLMYHELKHIPALGDKLKPHSVQDFGSILREAGLNWQGAEADVPDLFGDELSERPAPRRESEKQDAVSEIDEDDEEPGDW